MGNGDDSDNMMYERENYLVNPASILNGIGNLN